MRLAARRTLVTALLLVGFVPVPTRAAERSPVESILRRLARDPVQIVWSSRLIPPDRTAPEPDPALPLAERLEELLAPLGLAAVEEPENSWTVVRRDDPAARASLLVRVTSRPSGRPVAGATVRLRGTGARATSDASGEARLTRLPPGPGVVEVEAPEAGFRGSSRIPLRLLPGRETSVHGELDELPATSEEIVVTPSRSSLLRDDAAGATDLGREEIERLPVLGDDLFRAAARLPGAVANDFSAQMGVRGGEPRELTLRVDGFEIPRPWHLPDLQNLFGIVDSAIVDRMDLYAGGFPVEYGNAQSGVLDARTRGVEAPGLVEAGVSFLTARALVGRAFDGGGGWLAAGRRGYLDLVLQQVDAQGNLDPVYSDLFAKLERPIGRRTLAAIEVFGIEDRERFTSDDEGDEQLTGRARGGDVWLRFDSGWSERLTSRTVVGWSYRENRRRGFVDDGRSRLDDRRRGDDWTASQDWSWEIGTHHRLKAGWIVRRSEADYDFESLHTIRDPVLLRGEPPVEIHLASDLSPSGSARGIYLGDRWAPTGALALELGIRWDRQSWLGESSVAPRAQLVWRMAPGSELRAAWGRYFQAPGIDELQVEDGIESFHPVEEAVHRIVGWTRAMGRAGTLRLEAYEKRLPKPAARFENLFDPIQLFPSLEDDRVEIAPERARVRGVESAWSLRPTRRTTLDLSYVWSRAEDRIDGLWVPRRFDQTHAATAIVGFLPNERWSVEMVATYHSGWPTTATTLALVPGPDGDPVLGVELGPLYAERYPDYRRLDARVRHRRTTDRGSVDLYFEIFNLLNRDNVCCVDEFELVPNGTALPDLRRRFDTWLPLVPSFGVVWRR